MPPALVKSLAKAASRTVEKAEELWNKAKEKAEEMGHKLDYAYITGILKNMLGLSGETLLACGWPLQFICEAEAEKMGGEYFFYVGGISNGDRQNLLQALDELGLQVEWHFLEGDLMSVEAPQKAGDQEKLLKLFGEYDLIPGKGESRTNILQSMVLVEIYRVEKLRRPSVLLEENPVLDEARLGYDQEQMETFFPSASPELIKMLIGESRE